MKINPDINSKIQSIFPYFIFALVVFSVKLIIIDNYGNATPFLDQWAAEANVIYLPWIKGELAWSNLFSQHVYHRLFTTYLFTLATFYINGNIWNPILQMQANVVIHVIALITLLFYLSKHLSVFQRNALFIFCTIVFSIPFGFVSTLNSFNVQYYFYLLFSFIFLWSMVNYETYQAKWWLGIIAGILSFFSLALGVITIATGIVILIFRRYFMQEKIAIDICSIFLLTLMLIIAINLISINNSYTETKSNSIFQFLHSFANILAWPSPKFIGMFIIHAPILILSIYTLKSKEYQTKLPLFLIATTIWLFTIFAITAYGRGKIHLASRYTDIFAVGLVINFVALIILLEKIQPSKQIYISTFTWLWIITIAISFISSSGKLNQELNNKLSRSIKAEENVRAYLCSGNLSNLKGKIIPYPDFSILKKTLDNPIIRNFLPGNIYPPNANNPSDPDGTLLCKKYLPTVIHQSLPRQERLKVLPVSNCIGSIDHINDIDKPKQFSITSILGLLNVSGWISPSATQSLSTTESIVLILTDNKDKHTVFKTQRKNRPINFSNFWSTISTSHLPDGKYILSLGFTEGKTINMCSKLTVPVVIF